MIKITDLKIDAKATIGEYAYLSSIVPAFQYVNDQRTSEVIGYQYRVACPALDWALISVKILGQKQIEKPANGQAKVVFEGLEIYPYWSRRDEKYLVAARAAAIKILSIDGGDAQDHGRKA